MEITLRIDDNFVLHFENMWGIRRHTLQFLVPSLYQCALIEPLYYRENCQHSRPSLWA